jgi:hypothetical protein
LSKSSESESRFQWIVEDHSLSQRGAGDEGSLDMQETHEKNANLGDSSRLNHTCLLGSAA